MRRKYIYYLLTTVMGIVVVSGRLNTQLVIVNNLATGASIFPWELVILGWGSLLYSISSLLLASLSDRFERLPCIAVTALFIACMHGALGWKIFGPYRLWQFFICWGGVSLGLAVFFTGVEGLLSEYQDHKMPLARRLGLYCISWSFGGSAGLFITGYSKQFFGPEKVFRAVSLVCVGVFAIIMIDLFRHKTRMLGDEEVGEADIRPEAPFFARLGRVGLFFGSVAFASLSAAFPRFARDFHGFTEGEVGNLLSLITFMAFATFVWFPLWRGWHYKAPIQILLQGMMLAGLVLIIFTPAGLTVLLRAAFILFGTGFGFCYFFSIYYSLLVPKGHARSGGIHEGFLGLGKLIGPFVALGMIWLAGRAEIISSGRIGVMAMVVGAVAIVLSMLTQAGLYRKWKRG